MKCSAVQYSCSAVAVQLQCSAVEPEEGNCRALTTLLTLALLLTENTDTNTVTGTDTNQDTNMVIGTVTNEDTDTDINTVTNTDGNIVTLTTNLT